MNTNLIWNDFNEELYFFILKRVKNKQIAQDIFQNTFLKIHSNLSKLKNQEKIRAWIFQIARNEISNYYNKKNLFSDSLDKATSVPESIETQEICCFDKFINELPTIYKEVIELIYIKALKQKEVANELNISPANVKIRLKRAKEILKDKFNQCCKYEFDKNGKLIGEANCSICNN